MEDKWLVRLMDADKGNFIVAYYSVSPEQDLKTFYFCKEKNIEIQIPNEGRKGTYKDGSFGFINDIEVIFGGHETVCTINIWLEEVC